MGVRVAKEAFDRGADVTLVYGPGTVEPPLGPRIVLCRPRRMRRRRSRPRPTRTRS